MRQCDNGHFYDESRFDSCPYCQEGAGVGKTVAAGTVGRPWLLCREALRRKQTEARRWALLKRRSVLILQ